MNTVRTYTASEARKKLYALIRSASHGLQAYEIILRGSNPVVLTSKAELESWQETLDVLASPEERAAIRTGKKQTKTLSHLELLKALGLKESQTS